jgi:hypothetical protein
MNRDEELQNEMGAIVPPEPDDRLDHELVGWFALHEGIWCGTAAELLAAITSRVDVDKELFQSPLALYAHMESHKEILGSLGMNVRLPYGFPRMISLRPCQDEQAAQQPLSGASGIHETLIEKSPIAQSDADERNPGGVCDDTAEELLAMLRKSATLESRPSTVDKLAESPTLLWTAFKRAWMRRTRVM